MAKKNAFDFSALGNIIDQNKEKNKEAIGLELEDKKAFEAVNNVKPSVDTPIIIAAEKEQYQAPVIPIIEESDKTGSSEKEPDPAPAKAINKESDKTEPSASIKNKPGRPKGSKVGKGLSSPDKVGNRILDELIIPKEEKYQLPIYFDMPVLEQIKKYSSAYHLSKSEFVNLVMKKTMENFPKL